MFDKDKVEKSHYHYRYVCCVALPLWDVLFSKSLAEQLIPSKMVDHDEMKRYIDEVIEEIERLKENE